MIPKRQAPQYGGADRGPGLSGRGDAPPEGEMAMRKVAAITAIVVGIVMAVAGVLTWVVVGNTLSDQKITVSQDADCLAGDDVNGPFSAYCQAMVINKHTMGITGGKTYTEVAKDDPNRATAMDSAFLQASLFTSVVAFGVAAMAFVLGIVLALIGLAIRAPAVAGTRSAPLEPVGV